MNKGIFSKPPEHISVGGKDHEINTDFRVWAEILRELSRDDIDDYEKICMILVKALKKELPDNIDETLMKLLEFLSMGKKGDTADGNKRKVLDISADEGMIYAAFLSQYGIDLYEENMHWHKFIHLLNSLDKDCAIMRVVGFRAADTGKIKDIEQRRYYERMKRIYALDDMIDENEIANVLEFDRMD